MYKFAKYASFLAILGMGLFACEEDQDVVTADATEGAFLNIEGSSGTIAGGIDPSVPVTESPVDIQLAEITYNAKVGEGIENVDRLVVFKSFNGQELEVASSDNPAEGISLTYTTLDEFLSGFSGVSESDLRIGDVILFQTYMYMNDGRVLQNNSAALGIAVSCLADLSGTYVATNSACPSESITVEITKNPDGSYDLTSADGGFLNNCTANINLINSGTIREQCGEILPTGDLAFGAGPGYNIGNIEGGSWNGETGVLKMKHTQSFTGNWASEWESTYVRQ